MSCRRLRLFLLITCLLATAARADQLPEGFPFRRPLNFKQTPSDAPGVNLAVAEFYLNGAQKPDASDLRVTTADRQLVPCKILQSSPKDDFIRIAFETKGDGPYYAWWGNPKAEAEPKPLDIQRGILAEVFRLPPGKKDNLASVEKLYDKAPALGALFVPEIFLGYNPLGEEWGVMFRYTGQFKIDKPITAEFAFTVADTGSLIIDGKTVASTIRDKLHGRVRNAIPVDLSVGWHTIEVTQANLDGGQTGVVVAWHRPNDRNYTPLPKNIFPPVASAIAGPLEKIDSAGSGNNFAADFAILPEAEIFSPPESYLQDYAFDAEFPATFKPVITWDFGDGQVITNGQKHASHIYLAPGLYTVTLKLDKVGGGANSFTSTRRITIKDRMYSRFPHPPEDSGKTAAGILNTYTLDKLTGEQALHGYLFLKDKSSGADPATIANWGKAWLSTKDLSAGASEKVLFDETFDLARYLESQSDYRGAADAFQLAAQKTNGVSFAARLNLMRYSVMVTCDYTDDAAAALREAQDWLKKINENDKPQQRIAQAAILYAAIAKAGGSGNGAPDAAAAKLAQATLGQLKNPSPLNASGFNDTQIRQGVLARNVENYIRTGEFDTTLKIIDEWELEFPEALWDGFTRILRVKLATAEKHPLVAARLAIEHARANPNGVYADELLYRASQNFKAANEPTQAKAALDLLTSKYPESPYARGETKDK